MDPVNSASRACWRHVPAPLPPPSESAPLLAFQLDKTSDLSELAEFPFFGMMLISCINSKEKIIMLNKYRSKGMALAASVIFLIAKGSMVPAAEIQDQEGIRAAIEAAVTPRTTAIHDAEVTVEVGTIDSRLRLPGCDNIDVQLPLNNAAQMTAKVVCQDPAWTIYVPVHLHAWVDAVVAAANLPPNTKLTAAQLGRGRADMFGSNSGLLSDPREAEGKILRVGLIAGAPILTPLLDLPISVHRGQKVMLTLSDRAMTIKTTALALEDGRVGDSISVENPDTKKALHATVARDGGVEIRF
jgi:flagella basal body P-ring formation protein FlgA